MKKRIFAALLLGLSTTANAQIPTTDPVNIAMRAMEMLQQLEMLIDQYDALNQQIENQNRQIDAMTGGREMAGAVGTDDYNQIPTNWEETLQQMNGGQLSEKTNEILNTMNGIDPEAFDHLSDEYKEHFGNTANQSASFQALNGQEYDNASQRFEKLRTLTEKIDDTGDVKAAIDLNSRIQMEVAMLLNEAQKMQALTNINESQQQLNEVKASQEKAELNKEPWFNLEPRY